MPKAHQPRSGSMQFWPRKRAKRAVARVRSWKSVPETKPLGFGGYKVGMTHIIYNDAHPTSMTKNLDVTVPVTIIECPPLKVFGIRTYKRADNSLLPLSHVFADNPDKNLLRKLPNLKAKKDISKMDLEKADDIRLMVHTQPKLTGISKKKPEVFELPIGGKKEDQIAYAKEILGKEIKVEDIFESGAYVDVHGVTKGKGYQGAVKRFGISIKSHKSEKSRRTPGSLGPWNAQGKILYRVPHAGKMGYHMRTEYSKWILKLRDKPDEINQAGGFKRYGAVKNSYLLIKGSVAGASKRFLLFSNAMRMKDNKRREAPVITHISTNSHQG